MSAQATEQGHLVLGVEDDPETAEKIAAIVRSRGDRPVMVGNVADARQFLREFDPCYVLADHELPVEAGAEAMTGGGELLVEEARTQDLRMVKGRFHVRPIVVVTGVANDPDFVSRMYALGASHFQSKPLGKAETRSLLDKIRVCLERAERVQHEACGALVRERAAASGSAASGSAAGGAGEGLAAAVGPRIRVDGTKEKARMVIFVDGHRRTIQEGALVSLLRAIIVHERSRETWSAREVLYISRSRNATSRMRDPFRGLVPKGFDVLESDRLGRFRLNPAVVVEEVNWGVLAEHPNVQLRKMGKEQRDRLLAAARATLIRTS